MDEMSSASITITARVPKSVADDLKLLAGNEGRSLNNFLNKMLPIWAKQEKSKAEVEKKAA